MPMPGFAVMISSTLVWTMQTPPLPTTPPESPLLPPQKPSSPPKDSTTVPFSGFPAASPITFPVANKADKIPQKATVVVTVDTNPCLPGQIVTFYVPAGWMRGTVSGGSFGQKWALKKNGVLTDTPKKETTYTFDLWSPGAQAGKCKPAPKHQQFKVTVEVYSGAFPKLTTYRNPQRWHIDTVVGWIRNVIPQDDPATESLIYFQPEDDSPERISVAVRCVKEATCADLMATALMDAPTQYDILEHIQQKETMQCGVSASWATFDGVDHALPDIPTKSMVLTFVLDGKGYVISGRARANRFEQWEKLLRSLVRSFAIEPETQASHGS